MVKLTLADGSTISATGRHAFWNSSTHRFTYAMDLHVGDLLRTADGATIAVRHKSAYAADLMAYNLAIVGVHTYYVGFTAVLVHNECGPGDDLFRFGTGPQSVERLTSDAEAAAAAGFPYGVSVSSKLPPKFVTNGEFGRSTRSAVESAGLGVLKTGSNPYHYTVTFPKPVDAKLAAVFNRVFYGE